MTSVSHKRAQLPPAETTGANKTQNRDNKQQPQSGHQDCFVLMSALISPLPIALCVAGWEATYRLAGALIPRLYGNDASSKLKDRGASYLVALLHALIMAASGTWHVFQLIRAPLEVKLVIPRSLQDDWHAASAATEVTNMIFFSWLFYDLVHVIGAFPALGGVDTVLHHLGFLGASLVCGTYRILPFPFGWLLAGELSTIPLNVRWMLIHTNRGDTPAMQVANKTFAASFFAVRVLGYGAGLWHLWVSRNELTAMEAVVPSPLLHLVLGLLVGGYLLNLVWFRKILAMARKSGKRKKDQ